MKPHYFFLAMLLFFACKGGPGTETEKSAATDSATREPEYMLNSDSSISTSSNYRGPYVRHRVFTIRNLVFSTHTFSAWSDELEEFRQGHFLIVRDPVRKVADTIALDEEDGDMSDNEVEDMTDSLKFRTTVVKITSYGRSDVQSDEFFEYAGDSLRSLFSISFLRGIRRTGEYTLTAIEQGRDDVLFWGYNYPVTIDLRQNSVYGEMPDTQVIKHPTITLEPITVYKVRGAELSSPYEVKTGTRMLVDTFFKATGLVRMLLPDSTPVFIMREELTQKIEVNTAG